MYLRVRRRENEVERDGLTLTCRIERWLMSSDVSFGEFSLDAEIRFKTPGGRPAYRKSEGEEIGALVLMLRYRRI